MFAMRFWRWRRTQDEDLDRELAVHLDLAAEKHLDAGVPPREAKLAARREFGSVALAKEELRDMRASAAFARMGQEILQAGRRLLRVPTFTVAAVLTLALAIGANASIFAVVERVLLNPLPYARSDRLIALDYGIPRRNIPSGISSTTAQLYYQYLDRSREIDGLGLYQADELPLTGDGIPERIRVVRATPSLAAVLRVAPARGRWFGNDEGKPGAAQAAVLSHGLWVRRYGQDPNVVGRLVTLNGRPTTIVGVMPSSFAFPDPRTELWIPLPLSRATADEAYNYSAVARLRDGATVESARAELSRLNVDLAPTYPGGSYNEFVSTATTMMDATVGRVSWTLWILLAAVGLVLLVACANVANLFLVRAEARQREVAIRRALGAGRGGIARFFLAESAVLSAAGGALGLAVAWGAVRLLVSFGPTNLPRLHEVRLDGVAVMFTFVLAMLTALTFGSIPLLRLAPIAASLHDEGRGNTVSRVRQRARHLLMAGQIATALVLLISSGLMFRSFQKLRDLDPGFDPVSALSFRIGLPPTDYPDRAEIVAGHRAILERLSMLSGVKAVSASTCLPLAEQGGCFSGPLFVDGQVVPDRALRPQVLFRIVAGQYFEAMGMRLRRGRGIDHHDVDGNQLVAVVNDALVTIAFPNQDPIGQRVKIANAANSVWLTVVGVVSNTPTRALTEAAPSPTLYAPMFARDLRPSPSVAAMSYVVRTVSPPSSMTATVRGAVAEVDANLALAQVRTLQDILDRGAAQMAFTMILLAIAAGGALMLGVIGIYGAMSYIVSQRTGEIGVRLALGAESGSVARMIVRQGGLVAIAGLIVGLITALAGSRLIESLLYRVSPRDPGVCIATTGLLFGVALLACWLPARRAAHLSPLDALRTD